MNSDKKNIEEPLIPVVFWAATEEAARKTNEENRNKFMLD